MWEFLTTLASNPVFAGIAGGAGLSAVLYQARALPHALWKGVLRQASVSMQVDNSDELFERVAVYFSRSRDVRRSRWLRMVELYDDTEQKWRWQATFGPGWHLLRDSGRWFLFNRHIEEKAAGMTLKRRETLTIRVLGRSQEPIRQLMERAEHVYLNVETVRVYLWHEGHYVMADRKPKRGLATLFIPDAQKLRILDDLKGWLAERETYRRRGIPYRRGYLLEGPPGTGKTSLAFVMASELDRPVYLVNLSTAGGDTGLQAAFNLAEAGAVIVIEDIDSATITHDRATKPKEGEKPVEDPGKVVTLAGLLNAVDGLASRENRVLIVTSNHADVLDPALLRPGRIDCREYIGPIAPREAEIMCMAFLGDDAGHAFYRDRIAARLPMAPAALQGELIAFERERAVTMQEQHG